ncbi:MULTISPECIES: F0F1 ATP synthase subunit B [Ancylobacter]|uniref:ATP synthase subunit b n=1 Tax=Ancylobacter polymorphus TaxID=223390 RepID=A0A9E6ZU69_9HYPH|nr:F0F1 ATP synthase subunit B [Ancylobacter polymorphus]MPT22109.1 F0F1 ATP synthase subunit B [Starkeya sp.]UOK71804.1 F0F1 ATP synthase subunit B [Ancylobacter polymorphus]
MSEPNGPAAIIVAQASPGTLPAASGVEIAVPAAEAHGSNFPPFDVHTFPSQLLWLVIAFAALYLLMSRIALPRIATILEERHDRIADDIEEAGKLKAESEAAAEAYEKALASARNKAHGIATETRDTLAADAEARRKALEAELNVKLAAAEVQIAATKTSAMANVRGIAVDAAGAIVNTLIGTTPAPSAVEEAVDTAIKG